MGLYHFWRSCVADPPWESFYSCKLALQVWRKGRSGLWGIFKLITVHLHHFEVEQSYKINSTKCLFMNDGTLLCRHWGLATCYFSIMTDKIVKTSYIKISRMSNWIGLVPPYLNQVLRALIYFITFISHFFYYGTQDTYTGVPSCSPIQALTRPRFV